MRQDHIHLKQQKKRKIHTQKTPNPKRGLFISNLHLKCSETLPKKTKAFPNEITPSSCLYSAFILQARTFAAKATVAIEISKATSQLRNPPAPHQEPGRLSNPSGRWVRFSCGTEHPSQTPQKAEMIKPSVKNSVKTSKVQGQAQFENETGTLAPLGNKRRDATCAHACAGGNQLLRGSER